MNYVDEHNFIRLDSILIILYGHNFHITFHKLGYLVNPGVLNRSFETPQTQGTFKIILITAISRSRISMHLANQEILAMSDP